jgi:hypothetical protein
MPTINISGEGLEYIITDDVAPEHAEGDVPETPTHWGDAILWYDGSDFDSGKTPEIAKDLKELLGEPDWEI